MEAPREFAIGDLPVLRKARSAIDDDYLEVPQDRAAISGPIEARIVPHLRNDLTKAMRP